MPGIRRTADTLAKDGVLSRADAQALVDKIARDGKVTAYEKAQLKGIITHYRTAFEPAALQAVEALLARQPTQPAGGAVALDVLTSQRPVFLGPDGNFTVHADGKPPANATERGEALFRTGELIDHATKNLFETTPPALRGKVFEQLEVSLRSLPADPNQSLQQRASVGTAMLHLLEATSEQPLRGRLLAAYGAMIEKEPDRRLQASLVFHLSNSPLAQSGDAKQVADRFITKLAPAAPPYEKWFANGNTTVNLDWQVGPEFIDGFKKSIAQKGWKEVAGAGFGATVYEKAFNDPAAGETKFRITVRGANSTGLLSKLNDASVHIMGYDGHANWGNNQVGSIRNAPQTADGGDGKLFISNLCVGKSQIDAMAKKFPNLQVTTTYGSSAVDTDIDGLAKLLAKRAGWADINPFMDRVDGQWERNNFVTPASTLVRERVLDRDNDGQADYLDKHFNYSTFNVADDTAREFRPVRQDRPAHTLDGTKINIAAQVLNTVSEFSSVHNRVNPDSKVIAAGWFEPKAGEAEVVKFERVKGPGGKDEYRMSVNASYSHMSEEALRATCVYELNRFLQSSGIQTLPAVDRKLNAVIGFAQSLDIDGGYRDNEVWKSFLGRYNLPNVDRQAIQALLDAEHHDYAGSQAMIDSLKAKLSPDVLAALAKPEVGEPVRII
ncbi:MAG: hypothetical protein JNK82_19605 [Myxococcaceae bacterium]|nr:hypothetical protein [Myxococcaceae bacterium]